MKKRIAGVASALLAGALVLGGCSTPVADGETSGPSQAEEKPDKLVMLVTPSGSYTNLQQLAEKYTAKTGITIEFVEAPSDQLPTKIILAAQSKQNIFDMTMVDAFTMAQVVKAKALVPLDDYLETDETYDYADFPDGLKAYGKVGDVSYGLPLSTEPYLQWYRTDLFDELGLEPATNWDEAISNAETLKGAGHFGYAGVYGPAGSAHYYNAMLQSMGGRLIDPETFRPMLDTDLAKDAMEQYISLTAFSPEASFSTSALDVVNAFGQLQVGQAVMASGHWRTLDNPEKAQSAGKIATAQIPQDKIGKYEPASSLYGWLSGISSSSTHQKWAWDFLSWALSKENAEVFIGNKASPPARYSTTSNPDFVEQLPILPALADAAENGVPMLRIPEMPQIVNILSQDISSIATGQLTLDKGMETAQNHLLNILVQSGQYKG